MAEITKTFYARSRSTWRKWLEKNGATSKEIWLVYYKKHTGKPCVSYDASVEEALCFGWIDGLIKGIDEDKHALRFTPRKAGSIWSESNKLRVKKMIEQGLMTDAGLACIRTAKKNGQWTKAYRLAKGKTPPDDLLQALAAVPSARENFEAFAPSYRSMYVMWVLDAKRPETRAKRIRIVTARSAQNTKPGIDM